MKLLKFILVYAVISQSSAELFSAVEELESLAENEGKLYKEMQRMMKRFDETAEQLKRTFIQVEKEHQLMKKDSFRYVLNPLNAFVLIKTLTLDITKMKAQINGFVKSANEFVKNIDEVKLPQSEFDGAVKGLLRLQTIYGLRPEDLAKGYIQRDKYREELTVDELLTLGVEMINLDRLPMSLSYLELALDRNKEISEMTDIKILEKIYQNHKKNGDMKEALRTLEEMIKIAPNRKDLILDFKEIKFLPKEVLEKHIQRESIFSIKNETDTKKYERILLSNACHNQLKKSASDLSKLHCRFVSNNAFSKLAPFKVEEANLDPYIAIFYDVISDKEIEVFRLKSIIHLQRGVIIQKDGSTKVADIRIAKQSWHQDSVDKAFDRLTKRVGDMSGLNMKTSEPWQTQNYGIGGYYDCEFGSKDVWLVDNKLFSVHHDYTGKNDVGFKFGTGNRIATALFYLSDVEKGGSTVFPYLKITVPPKKGSAVFWYNLSTSGDLEYYTRHAACPVLVGSKWVANKWLHEYGQEWTRPCELEPRISDEFYYQKAYQ